MSELHGHHSIEDMHYFPVLKGLDIRVARGFDILDRDHHAIDGHLSDFAEVTNAAIRAVLDGAEGVDEIAAFERALARMGGFLDRHLTDEEELVVPVLLKHAPAGLV